MIVADTSGLLAAIDASQRDHERAARALRDVDGPILLSPFVLAELDYLLTTRVGQSAETAFLSEVERGVYQLESFSAGDIAACRAVIERYAELELGLADASIVVLAERHATRDLLTLDERHFRAISPRGGGSFRLLPADAL